MNKKLEDYKRLEGTIIHMFLHNMEVIGRLERCEFESLNGIVFSIINPITKPILLKEWKAHYGHWFYDKGVIKIYAASKDEASNYPHIWFNSYRKERMRKLYSKLFKNNNGK